jgi:hypothetical protein
MSAAVESMSAIRTLSAESVCELEQCGFTIILDAVPRASLERLSHDYDAAMASAGADAKVGSTTTRVGGLENRVEGIEALCCSPPLLEACCRVIRAPFELSALHARSLRPHSLNGKLHVDVARDSSQWPLVGFILMVDDFRPDNGATRFVPGSHRWPHAPPKVFSELRGDHAEQVHACGPAGSLVIFDGSTWHDHGVNASDLPRRSIQGAFIPRDGNATGRRFESF